jgi:hypothetical protein
MSDKRTEKTRQKNEGEGSRTAARSFNQSAKDFAKSGKVDKAARKAEKAVENDSAGLKKAEEKGRARAKAFDPAVSRKAGGA